MPNKWTLGLLLVLALSSVSALMKTPDLSQDRGVAAPRGLLGSAAIQFLIGASPTSLSIFQGYIGWSTIDVYTVPGQSGNVNLAVSAPVGLTAKVNPSTVSLPPSPAESTLTIFVGPMTRPGAYLVVVNGTSGASSHSVGVSVIVLQAAPPSFEVSSSPASLTIPAGTNGTSTIGVNSINGFTGDVRLTATVSPTGPSASFNPTNIVLSSDQAAYSTMKVSVTSLIPAGNYTITIQGSNGTISDSSVVEVFVGTNPMDFEVSSSPASLTIPAGTNGTSAIGVNSINSFTGDVRLTATVSPTGPSASFNPTDIVLSSTNRSGTSVLSVATTSSTALGSYIIKINGISNSITHFVAVSLIVIPGAPPSFGVSASPSSLALQAGSSDSSMMTLTSLNGFSGSVTLSLIVVVPNLNPPTISFDPASVRLSPGKTANSSLIVSTTTSTPGAAYNVLVQASNGLLSETWAIEVFVNVTPLDFSLSVTPTMSRIVQGFSANYQITISSLSSFSGIVSLSPCQSCTSPLASARPMITVSPTDITLGPGGTANSRLTLSTNSTTPAGTYAVVVNGRSGGLFHLVAAFLVVTPPPDFSLTLSSTNVSFTAGSTAKDNILASGTSGFAASILFTALSTPPTGLTVLCPSISLNSTTASSSSTCTFSSSTAGNYSVALNGTGGSPSLTRQVKAFVAVIKASPTITTFLSAANVTVGGSASDSAILAGTAGAAGGTVAYNLFSGASCTGTPTLISDVTVSGGVIPSSAPRRFNSTGTFSWNAVYSGDSKNDPATSPCELFLVIPVLPSKGFTISASVASVTVEQGDAGRIIIILESSGFAGRVNLAVVLSPMNRNALRTIIRPASVELPSNSSRRVLLIVFTNDETPVGNYNITVIGSAGSISRSVILSVAVTAPSEVAEDSCMMTHVNCSSGETSDDCVAVSSLTDLGLVVADNSGNFKDSEIVSQLVF